MWLYVVVMGVIMWVLADFLRAVVLHECVRCIIGYVSSDYLPPVVLHVCLMGIIR